MERNDLIFAFMWFALSKDELIMYLMNINMKASTRATIKAYFVSR